MDYSTDKAITRLEEDLLGRASFSQQLGRAIYEYRGKESLVIGLYGKWGTGKTSVVNMALQEIEDISKKDENKPMIIRFAPWNYSDKDNLISQFLNTLKVKIDNEGSDSLKKVGEALNEYSEAFNALSLIPTIGPVLALLTKEVAKAGGKYLSQPKDLSATKKKIEVALSEANKKIVVLIDDIDRLTNSQIRDIFQLVKQVGDLPNIIYFLVMDRDIVTRALIDVHDYDGNEYLEKIVQIPFELPSLDKTKLQDIFFEKLDRVIKEIPDEISWEQQYWYKIIRNCIEPYICTLRDVNRVINTFQLKYNMLYRETAFEDMVGITIIEVLEPELYKWISRNKDAVCGGLLHSLRSSGKKVEEYKTQYLREFQELGIDIKKAIKCVAAMFPVFAKDVGEHYYVGNQDDSIRRKMRVAQEERFRLYFMLDLEAVRVSRGVMNECVYKLDEENLLRVIKAINKNGDIGYFLEELRSLIQNIPYDRIELIASVLIDTANTLKGEMSIQSLQIPASLLAENLASILIKRIDTDERRFSFLQNEVRCSDKQNIGTIAQLLNEIKRLCNRSLEEPLTDIEHLVNDEQLKILEQEFLNKIQEIEQSENIIELDDFHSVFFLWQCINSDDVHKYISELMKNDVYKLKFVCSFARKWHGSNGEGWWFDPQTYSEYITDKEIYELIQNYGKSHLSSFTELEKVQMASFDLNYQNDVLGHANEQRALEQVKKWENA